MTETTMNMNRRIKTGIKYIKMTLKFEFAEMFSFMIIGPSF